MTSNPSPDSTPDLTTPRDAVIAAFEDHCDIGNYSDGSADPEGAADAILLALDYDRLRAIEAAARALNDSPKPWAKRAAERDALRAAIQGGSKT